MDTQLFQALIAVAETGSFSAAAERLFISQPAVSKRIATLEARFKVSLLDRMGRTARLTEAGRTLLPHAQQVLQQIEDSRRALEQLSGHVHGRLSIGTSHHIGLHRLPPILRSYVQKYPQVELDIQFMDSEEACHAVVQGDLELGIVTLPTQPLPHLQQQLIWPDSMSVVVGPDHPLARQQRVAVQTLAQHPALLPDSHTYTHGIIAAAFDRLGLQPQLRLQTNYLETISMLVSIGLGWSALPDSMHSHELQRLKVPRLRLHRDLGVVWNARRSLTNAAQSMRLTLQQAAM